LEADGVEHPRWGLTKPGGGSAFDGFAGKTLGNEATEAIQVHKVGKLEAVTEGATGSENRIPQAQRANFYAEVNGASGTHFVGKNTTKLSLPVAKSLAPNTICLKIKSREKNAT
jgi:hypothetical protein